MLSPQALQQGLFSEQPPGAPSPHTTPKQFKISNKTVFFFLKKNKNKNTL